MDEILREKVAIIAKDLDSGYLVFNRFAVNLMTMRGWSLTLVFSFVTLLVTVRARSPLLLVPLAVVLLLFMYLEASDRRDMASVREAICRVHHIFMESDPIRFMEGVKKYEFRELTNLKRRSLFKFAINFRLVVWYGLVFLLASVTYIGSILIHSI
jgi:hypothetical protein